MTTFELKGLSANQMMMLGDAALKAGDLPLARGLYRKVIELAPRGVQAHSRFGLVQRPNQRIGVMLEVIKKLEEIPNANVFIGEGIATWFKMPAFVYDETFMRLAEEEQNLAPVGIVNWHWNLQTVLWAAQQARTVPGDFVELGVYKGHTTHFLARYLDFAAWDKRWWLVDTFEGVPVDQRDKGREQMGASAYGEAFSLEEVRGRFAPFPNIEVVKGRVPEVLAQEVSPDAIAFIHIDLNNSSAEVAALDALYPKLSPGGVIVFDDFGWTTSHQQAAAESDWFKRRGLSLFPLPTGQAVFVKPAA